MGGWNGSGVFSVTYNWENDATNGIKISSSRMDGQFTDVVNGLNNVLCKDGQNSPTANLPMAGFIHTGVGNGTARNNYASVGQLQDKGPVYAVTTGTNTIALTLSPVITAYVNGATYTLNALNTTTAAATLNINGVGALNLYSDAAGLVALPAGAIIAGGIYDVKYNSAFNSAAGGFQILNPSLVKGSFTGTLTGGGTSPTATFNYDINTDGKGFDSWCAAGLIVASTSTACTVTGVPTAIQSTTNKNYALNVQNNTAATAGFVATGTGGTWTLGCPGANSFTSGSGNKGWNVGAGFHGTLD